MPRHFDTRKHYLKLKGILETFAAPYEWRIADPKQKGRAMNNEIGSVEIWFNRISYEVIDAAGTGQIKTNWTLNFDLGTRAISPRDTELEPNYTDSDYEPNMVDAIDEVMYVFQQYSSTAQEDYQVISPEFMGLINPEDQKSTKFTFTVGIK